MHFIPDRHTVSQRLEFFMRTHGSPQGLEPDATERRPDPTEQRLELASPAWGPGFLGRLELRVWRAQSLLIASGLVGLFVVGLISIPGNRVFDVNLRPHHLIGMLFSHASVLALLIGLSPRRSSLLQRAQQWPPAALLGWSLLACGALLEAWLALFPLSPAYLTALARESGPLEPVQAALYTVASWLGWQCARRAARPDDRRLFRAATFVCAWLAVEEVEYFGVLELTAGGRIHGVWVRAMHDFIALSVRVPALRSVLIILAVALIGAALWYIGPRCLLRQAGSPAAIPAILAVGVLALSQILDQDNTVIAGYSPLLTYRLEEPLELVAALLINVALAIKYGEAQKYRGAPEVRAATSSDCAGNPSYATKAEARPDRCRRSRR